MHIIGVLSGAQAPNGTWTLKCGRKRIPVVGNLEEFRAQRVRLEGQLSLSRAVGSYFRVYACALTTETDCNLVQVSGVITGVLPEIMNSRGVRSACIFIRQTDSHGSTVLVTALSSSIDVLDPNTLIVGDSISVSGYISSHRKGLHVLYVGTN